MKVLSFVIAIFMATSSFLQAQDSVVVSNRWRWFIELHAGICQSTHGYPNQMPLHGALGLGIWKNSYTIAAKASLLQNVAGTVQFNLGKQVTVSPNGWRLHLETGAGIAWLQPFKSIHFGDAPPAVPNLAVPASSNIFKSKGWCGSVSLAVEKRFMNGAAISFTPEWKLLSYCPVIHTTYHIYTGAWYVEQVEVGEKHLFQHYIGLNFTYSNYFK